MNEISDGLWAFLAGLCLGVWESKMMAREAYAISNK